MALEFLTNALKGTVTPKKEVAYTETEEDKKKSAFDKYGPDETLFKWTYEGRIPRGKINPRFLRMATMIGIFVGIVLALMQDFVMILMIGSIIFFYYIVHNKYTPTEVAYEITKYGFRYGGKFYFWGDIKSFFFSRRGEMEFLVLDTTEDLLGRVIVLFHATDKEKIFGLIKERALYLETEPKNSVDNFVDFISSKFNTDVK